MKKLWHLHYALDLFTLTCNQFKVTEQSTGESLKNFTLTKGCLIIADRAYGTIKSIEHCLAAGRDFIIRIKNKPFHIYEENGRKLVLSGWLRTVGNTATHLNVFIRNSEKKLIPVRICACKKTEAEIAAEKTRIRKMESRKQRKLSDETVFTHNYMFVITSLPSEISAAQILSCYCLRWQVELVFKRLKSLLGLGSIPTKTKEAGQTWINGKILLSLLTEKYLGDIDFPPLGTFEANRSIWRETKLVSFIIFMMILPNIQMMSLDILKLVKITFIEKRKHTRQQLLRFL